MQMYRRHNIAGRGLVATIDGFRSCHIHWVTYVPHVLHPAHMLYPNAQLQLAGKWCLTVQRTYCEGLCAQHVQRTGYV